MINSVINIRSWLRTNGELSEDGKWILYETSDIEDMIQKELDKANEFVQNIEKMKQADPYSPTAK